MARDNSEPMWRWVRTWVSNLGSLACLTTGVRFYDSNWELPSSAVSPMAAAEFSTSAGRFRVRIVEAWSPRGARRFRELVQQGHFNDSRVYRVVQGWVAQFGMSGNASRQREQTIIEDDGPSVARNVRGAVSFSGVYTQSKTHATNRSTELFINLGNNFELDALGFTPIGMVMDDGMKVVDAFYRGYGEMTDACDLHHFIPCDGPESSHILEQGNKYLDQNYPQLTRIYGARILDSDIFPAEVNRVELHCHLDGAIPLETLFRVSQRRQLQLPNLPGVPTSVEDVWTSLQSCPVWQRFDLVNDIIGGDEQTLHEIAEEFVHRQALQRVNYTEVRYDPLRAARSNLAKASIGVEQAVRAIESGLRAGSLRYGVEAYQLLCAMRGSPAESCFELARLAAQMRSGELGGVVGIDLAGDEFHFNNSYGHVAECFRYAKLELLLNTTVHAGELAGGADVVSAVKVMLADRVGHGYSAVNDQSALAMLIESNVHLEACPAGHDHNNLNATAIYRKYGLNFGLSTDDPASYFQNTSIEEVETLVRTRLGFSALDIWRAQQDAYAARFAPSAARVMAMQPKAPSSSVTAIAIVLAAAAFVISFIVFFSVKRWQRGRAQAWRGRVRKAMAALEMSQADELQDS